jgi:uncharacterized membrane protein YhaH (DUF805 family)
MLFGLMEGIAIFYYWTWFIWPFIFVISFVFGLAEIIKDEENSSGKNLFIASISLLIILAGVVAPMVHM